MKDVRDNKFVPFPAGLLAGALVLTGVMFMHFLALLFSRCRRRPG